jgi:hypothetical protein
VSTSAAGFAGSRGTEPGMLVLDAGAGRSPYRNLFRHARYEAADFAQLSTDYAPLDYVCDLTQIPVEDGWKYTKSGMPKNYVVARKLPAATS